MNSLEASIPCSPLMANDARPPAPAGHGRGAVSLLDVTTLLLWSGCVLVGVIGLWLGYPRRLPVLQPAPMQAELLQVQLTTDPLPPLAAAPPPRIATDSPPPVPELQPLAPAVPLATVAAADAVVAFPLPVEGPVQIVPAETAPASVRVETRVVRDPAPVAPVEPLTYGVGEGRQPAPEYPRASLRAGQEGTVRVRFSVGSQGRVLTAEAASPCPWPLLNDSAIRVVRERWRFRPGAPRLFEVSIRFELNQ